MNMKFYKSIAKYYDYIFPYNSNQKDFIISSINEPYREKSVLDIGCGTGNLTLELSKCFNNIVGIDSDREMIRLAKSKIKRFVNSIGFKYLNMLDIGKHFAPSVFDVIICFGNTLVHLADSGEIESFLMQTKTLLKPGRKLLLQIVHYDRILKQSIQLLPLIENEMVKFERYYSYHRQQRVIDFKTILTVKKENRVIKNCVQLYPLLKKEVENILKNVGYRKIFYYGSFKKEGFTQHSPPLIIEAR